MIRVILIEKQLNYKIVYTKLCYIMYEQEFKHEYRSRRYLGTYKLQ